MGTINHQEIIFDELINSRMRAFAGKSMIDKNKIYSPFKEETDTALKSSYRLAEKYHGAAEGRIKYAFAPRFVLSCSEELLKGTKELKDNFSGSLFHTHASENKTETEEIKSKYGIGNIEYFHSIGLLDDAAILAHCVHVDDCEIEILKSKNVRVAHCPSSNLKLASGIANIPRYLDEGISVSFGADGAPCNNSLSIFNEMKLASLIQKPKHGAACMNALQIFRMATIEAAKALHINNETGSVEIGKKADLVLLDLDSPLSSLADDNDNSIYTDIVFSSSGENVKEVMIEGEWVVRESRSMIFNQQNIFDNAKMELKNLLKRIKE